MCFTQFQNFFLRFLKAVLTVIINGGKAKFALGGIKAGGSRTNKIVS